MAAYRHEIVLKKSVLSKTLNKMYNDFQYIGAKYHTSGKTGNLDLIVTLEAEFKAILHPYIFSMENGKRLKKSEMHAIYTKEIRLFWQMLNMTKIPKAHTFFGATHDTYFGGWLKKYLMERLSDYLQLDRPVTVTGVATIGGGAVRHHVDYGELYQRLKHIVEVDVCEIDSEESSDSIKESLSK